MSRVFKSCVCVVAALAAAGCSSLVSEGGSAGAGIVSGALASAISSDPGVAAGIGIGVQAAARSGIAYGQRRVHGEAQQQIAAIAGPLAVGQVETWRTAHSIPLEPSEAGRVAVSRIISTGALDCKEIVFSVDQSGNDKLAASAFYVASICRTGSFWAWASAEPATARWGSLQ
ncbi:MAG: hypothetical protein JWQ11_2223 [Rhizobacter sp.]|nr:hypothetical protein [Rhizobacter sp.]